MLVIVTYDISLLDTEGNRRLRKVARLCQNYGVRVQNSVFECRIDATQYEKLKHLIKSEINEEKDSVRFYSLGNNFKGKIEHIGLKIELTPDEPLIL